MVKTEEKPCWQVEKGATVLTPNHDQPSKEQAADPFPYKESTLTNQIKNMY